MPDIIPRRQQRRALSPALEKGRSVCAWQAGKGSCLHQHWRAWLPPPQPCPFLGQSYRIRRENGALSSRTSERRSGAHTPHDRAARWQPQLGASYYVLWLWVPAFAGTTPNSLKRLQLPLHSRRKSICDSPALSDGGSAVPARRNSINLLRAGHTVIGTAPRSHSYRCGNRRACGYGPGSAPLPSIFPPNPS